VCRLDSRFIIFDLLFKEKLEKFARRIDGEKKNRKQRKQSSEINKQKKHVQETTHISIWRIGAVTRADHIAAVALVASACATTTATATTTKNNRVIKFPNQFHSAPPTRATALWSLGKECIPRTR
jgi:hypothetical protein